MEVVSQLKEKRGLTFPNEKFALFVDGGVRRATDVIKAVALGATAGNFWGSAAVRCVDASLVVGIGRPFLYALSSYGQEGVERALQILHVPWNLSLCQLALFWFFWQDEFEMNMRLLGARTIKDITPDMVDISNISSHVASIPGDKLYDINCEFKILRDAQYFLCQIALDESMQHAKLREAKPKL